MSDEIKVKRVALWLCELCLSGKGGICNVPGCALCRNRAPDLAIAPELMHVFPDERPAIIDTLIDIALHRVDPFGMVLSDKELAKVLVYFGEAD